MKSRSWLSLMKRLLYSETNHKHNNIEMGNGTKMKGRRWMVGKLVLKRTKAFTPPTPTPTPTQSQDDEEEEDQKQKLSICSQETLPSQLQLEDTITNQPKLSAFYSHNQTYILYLAAIKIQTLYRAYLARKALRALKGFVRLQAMIRGRAVRRQAMTTLKCLESIAKIQSDVCARRCQMIRGNDGELQLQLQLQDLRNENSKIQVCRQRRKDNELLTKEEQIDIILKKKEDFLRRKRAIAYSFNHRHSADSEDGVSEARLRYWVEQYVSEEEGWKRDDKNGLNIFNTTLPRRSYHKHKKQNSCGEDNLHSISPLNIPTYMASTESAKAKAKAKAKARSLSISPRLRSLHADAYSDTDSPYKSKLSPMSSINSEATCSGFTKFSNKSTSFSSSQQKSPNFKGISGPIRSNKSFN